MIRLLIKTHSKTGAKYFCKTNRSNWQQYKGSGPYWLNHLKSYGEEHITEVYAEFKEECDELVETALKFSEENDIVNSDLWKNLIPENGLGGGGWMKGLTYEECFGKSKASLIKEKLSKQNIHSIPLISSTLNDNDFYFDKKIINPAKPRLIYVGYLRKTKGVETIIKTFILLKKEYPEAELTIVGTGELECFLQDIIKKSGIDNITFTGHIDDRNNLNKLLRRNDIFCFGSLSEGSPRVVLEAMANGLVVVSTPVGSLPNTFIDGQEILFADFNNEQKFCEKIISLIL